MELKTSNQKLKEILNEATAKGLTIQPEKALLLADLADGLGLSAESIVRLTAEQVRERRPRRNEIM